MDSVVWSIRGTYFAVIVDTKIHVFDVKVAGIIAAIDCTSRITCLSFLQVINFQTFVLVKISTF